MQDEIRSAVPLGLAQMLGRLSIEEKREFVRLIDWEELQQLRLEAACVPDQAPASSDPKVYVGTTKDGLSIDLPVEHASTFIAMLPRLLSVEAVGIFVQDGKGSDEHHCAAADLKSWLASHVEALYTGSVMVELGPHTLITGGGGCFSLALENVSAAVLREIAGEALALCGFHHAFKADRFSGVVWGDQLEVTE